MADPVRKPTVVPEINTLLGRGSEFEGKLTFEGAVRIDGEFKGEVFSDDVLIIGEGAHVEAEIDIGEVIVQGTVVGNIRAKRGIEIHAPGRVKGDLTTPVLQIEKGVIFEGRSFMEGIVDKPGTSHRVGSVSGSTNISGTSSSDAAKPGAPAPGSKPKP